MHDQTPSFDSIGVLQRCAAAWAADTGRTLAALANQVVSSPQLFDRLAAGGSITSKNWDRLMNFLADPANWSSAAIPATVAPMLAGHVLNVAETTGSPGKAGEIICRPGERCPA